jgi:hypothetical protein
MAQKATTSLSPHYHIFDRRPGADRSNRVDRICVEEVILADRYQQFRRWHRPLRQLSISQRLAVSLG